MDCPFNPANGAVQTAGSAVGHVFGADGGTISEGDAAGAEGGPVHPPGRDGNLQALVSVLVKSWVNGRIWIPILYL